MIYKNLSHATKTFFGVTFKPGEEHEVPGVINDSKFIRLNSFTKPFVETTSVKTESAVSVADEIVSPAPIVNKKSGKSKKEEVITDGTNCG